jgi:hypothetical protein
VKGCKVKGPETGPFVVVSETVTVSPAFGLAGLWLNVMTVENALLKREIVVPGELLRKNEVRRFMPLGPKPDAPVGRTTPTTAVTAQMSKPTEKKRRTTTPAEEELRPHFPRTSPTDFRHSKSTEQERFPEGLSQISQKLSVKPNCAREQFKAE